MFILNKNHDHVSGNIKVDTSAHEELFSEFNLIKNTEYYSNLFTPKISLRFNPSDMKDYSVSTNKIDVNNIFSTNRLGLSDTFETGRSLTLGFDFLSEKKNTLDNINNFFEFKLATVFRDKEENFISNQSTLNKKNSNIFGSINKKFSENMNFLDINNIPLQSLRNKIKHTILYTEERDPDSMPVSYNEITDEIIFESNVYSDDDETESEIEVLKKEIAELRDQFNYNASNVSNNAVEIFEIREQLTALRKIINTVLQ